MKISQHLYDSKDGPILGEFTPFSALGKADPLPSCVMSYLFTAHAKHGGLTDDADLAELEDEPRE